MKVLTEGGNLAGPDIDCGFLRDPAQMMSMYFDGTSTRGTNPAENVIGVGMAGN